MPGYGIYYDTPWYSQKDKIKKVIIEEGVTSIASTSFYGCSEITSVSIPNSVTCINSWAFYGCSKITSISIPNSVTSIYQGAFNNCSGLTSITIPNSVTSIGEYTFSGTKWYDNQPDGLVYAGKVLYKYKGTMPSNTKIEIKEGTTGIADYAFQSCKGLTSITIPNSVMIIGSSAFSGCSGLTSINIPNSVTEISSEAFSWCSGLTSITIPNSVTIIRGCVFSWCSGLTSINIPNSVTGIGDYAFQNCTNLTSIIIPNSVTFMGTLVFVGCSSLTSITCEATIPPTHYPSCFYDVDKSIPVYVPANSITKYKVADEWKDFTNIQAIPGSSLTNGTPYTNNLQLNGRDVSYTRTFNNTNWQALYIPFSLNYNDWKDDFEVAYINGVRQLDKDDNGTIDETIMDVIKIKSGSTTPNMPYLIKAKTIGEKTFSVSDATLYPAEENSIDCSTTIAKYTFTGTYNTISSATMIANNYYGMGGGELVQSDGSNDLNPYRWYMKVESRNSSYNASNAAKTITINVIGDEEETTTGIRQLQITNDELPVYDLNGRQVNENNLKPGIYVKNGKKFVVK